MKTGNTPQKRGQDDDHEHASMEPGHEDREYRARAHARWEADGASMEPGHEDREYVAGGRLRDAEGGASMEPGHEDREYST